MKAPFLDRAAFRSSQAYRLLPFRFGQLDGGRYVLTNDVGEHVLISRDDLVALTEHRLTPDSDAYRKLKSRHFVFDEYSRSALDLLALKYRTRLAPLAEFTGLHLFVVTLRCDHSCHYCQVSRQTEERTAFDMTSEHAEKALEMVFRSPSPRLKIEFQGGEPLLNFPLVRHIVERAEQLNQRHQRDLAFVIASNLSRLDDDVLAFCKAHRIHLSTSLDGPKALHERQRPLRSGSSYEATLRGIQRAREALGHGAVSALMTTTPASLASPEAIVDEYVQQGFFSIFLRSLSPYGFAVRTSLVRRYGVEDWLAFYRRGLARVLEHNDRGTPMREEFTAILLQKILSPSGTSYVDLQSPAGLGIGALLYNYDGAVYASDEGRMLAEMGDTTFRLGHLDHDTYEEMLTSSDLLECLDETMPEGAPQCSDCPFLPYCGADPVFHKATQGEAVGHKAFSAFCQKQMGALRHILALLEDNPTARQVLQGWV